MEFWVAIFLLIVFLVALAFLLLIVVSWLTPWPRRTRTDLLRSRYEYTPDDDETIQFQSLLEVSDNKLRHTKPSVYLSVVIPAMNEAERLPLMLQECFSYLLERRKADGKFTFEVIVVDDGSTDSTSLVGLKYSAKYGKDMVKVLKLERNQGKVMDFLGSVMTRDLLPAANKIRGAVRNGVLCSRGAIILFVDADGATRFSDFENVETELIRLTIADGCLPKERTEFDWTFPAISVGSRAHMEKESIATRSLARTVLMIGFHLLVQVFVVRKIRDTQCGFKLFTRSAAARLFSVLHVERWAFDAELLFLAERNNYPVCEVPVNWHEVDGSKIVPILSWLQMGRDLLLIWFSSQLEKVEFRRKLDGSSIGLKMDSARKKSSKNRGEKESSQQGRLFMEAERVINTYDNDTDVPTKSSEKWDVKKYCSKISIDIVNESEDGMAVEFDLMRVEAPIANTLRRVLLAEVPTMAIEKVYLYQNTSVIQDEVLCHRLGLLPIRADPRLFEMPLTRVVGINESGVDCEEEPAGDPKRNLIFEINVSCKKNPRCPKTATEPKDLYENAVVYSNSFRWVPIGDQAKTLPYRPTMVHDDILVAKLRPGQEIEAKCHCVKGQGRDHAKFSPVATASYRLLPEISLLRDFTGEDAGRVSAAFSEGVIGINSAGVAYVRDARRDTCSRNILRYEDLAKDVVLSRRKDHFIFSVESTGALKSNELVVEACKVIEDKCRSLKKLFTQHIEQEQLVV